MAPYPDERQPIDDNLPWSPLTIRSKEQRNYCTTRKELLAVVRFTRQFRPYLLGRHVHVRTDHSSLRFQMGFREAQGQLARWLEELSQCDMEIIHRPGRLHGNADSLSRMPATLECSGSGSSSPLASLPCGGCNYWQRMERSWGRFIHEVDDVVPLSTASLRLIGHIRMPQSD
ncbi:Pol polyprotein [Plakobranchus ocellatus]|uniref:Pol polyprotein n=1 Tax=Plakobranchus ocellatus TaxID=259542 RepID=A0AAV4CE30_9GAST|nr:Pol polyprotein [Plakobranchus ocellatus]